MASPFRRALTLAAKIIPLTETLVDIATKIRGFFAPAVEEVEEVSCCDHDCAVEWEEVAAELVGFDGVEVGGACGRKGDRLVLQRRRE